MRTSTKIPESSSQKEADHIEGFVPELPFEWQKAGEKLEERLAPRPIWNNDWNSFSNWIIHTDLPYEINQWANVFVGKENVPFLRTSEFLWQEGHTAHADEERRRTMRMRISTKKS